MKYLILMIILAVLLVISPAYSGINSDVIGTGWGYLLTTTLASGTSSNYSLYTKFKVNTMPTDSKNACIDKTTVNGSYVTVHYVDAADMKVKTKIRWLQGTWFAGEFDSGITVSTDEIVNLFIDIRVDGAADIIYIDYNINGSTATDSVSTSGWTIDYIKKDTATTQSSVFNTTNATTVYGDTKGCDMDIFVVACVYRTMTANEKTLLLSRPGGSTLFAKRSYLNDIKVYTGFEYPDETVFSGVGSYAKNISPPAVMTALSNIVSTSTNFDNASSVATYFSNTNSYKKTRRK